MSPIPDSASARDELNRLCTLLVSHRRVLFPDKENAAAAGQQLGATPDQHQAALDNALQALPAGPSMPPPDKTKDVACLEREVERLVEAATGSGKGKGDLMAQPAALRDVLCMSHFLQRQQQQQQHDGSNGDATAAPPTPPLIRSSHADVLQRKLAALLPATTKLPAAANDAAAAAALQQLRARCAVAKGRHRVEYASHAGAAALLELLAEQNRPRIKAVLRAVDGCSAFASEAACRGELEVSSDVRGVLIAPLPEDEPLAVPNCDGDVFLIVAHLLTMLRETWDTVALRVRLGPDAGDGSSGAGAALEAACKAMQQMAREGRGACLLVTRDEEGGGWARERAVLLTLAQTDPERRGMLLQNSREVVAQAVRRHTGGPTAEQRANLLQRMDAFMAGADAVLDRLGTQLEYAACDGLIETMRATAQHVGQLFSSQHFDLSSGMDDDDGLLS